MRILLITLPFICFYSHALVAQTTGIDPLPRRDSAQEPPSLPEIPETESGGNTGWKKETMGGIPMDDTLVTEDNYQIFASASIPDGVMEMDSFRFIRVKNKDRKKEPPDGSISFTDPDPPQYSTPGKITRIGTYLNESVDLITKSAVDGDNAGMRRALKRFEAILQADPQFYPALFNASRTHYLLKDFLKARFYMERAIGLLPGYSGAYRELGLIQDQLKNEMGATENLKHAFQLNPLDPSPLSDLGEIKLREGNLHTAEIYFRNALSMKPCDMDAQIGMARILLSKNQVSNAYERLRGVCKETKPIEK